MTSGMVIRMASVMTADQKMVMASSIGVEVKRRDKFSARIIRPRQMDSLKWAEIVDRDGRM
jgi:hypothetical protein